MILNLQKCILDSSKCVVGYGSQTFPLFMRQAEKLLIFRRFLYYSGENKNYQPPRVCSVCKKEFPL